MPQQAAMRIYCCEPGPSDLGYLQVSFEIHGELDAKLWQESWTRVGERHDAMRMTIHAPSGRPPMVIIWKKVDIPVDLRDLRSLQSPEKQSAIEQFCEESRKEGIDLGQAPATRVATFQLDDQRHRVVWSCHHLFLDGWSSSIIVKDVLAQYENALESDSPKSSYPQLRYRRYRESLKKVNPEPALAYWQDLLADARQHHLLPTGKPGQLQQFQATSLTLSESETKAIEAACKDGRFTANAVIRAALALVLLKLTGDSSAVFGAVVSGRLAEVEGVDTLAGNFANTVPVRVTIEEDEPLIALLHRIRDHQLRAQPFEHIFLGDIIKATGMKQNPFDLLLLVQNIPWDGLGTGSHLSISDYSSAITSNFPLTLALVPGKRWELSAHFQKDAIDPERAVELLAVIGELIREISRTPEKKAVQFLAEISLRLDSLDGGQDMEESASVAFAGPRNQSELELLEIWQNVLGKGPVSIHDNFFNLGGKSIQAVQLFNQIEKNFGKRLPLDFLLQNPTVAELSSHLQDNEEQTALKCLVPIKTGGNKPPLFCLHAGGGHVLFYRDFAESLGDDYNVYGLQPVGLDGKERPFVKLEDMAARYLKEMRAVRPSGPYFIMGHCYSGAVAMEIGQQIRKSTDDKVDLILIDPPSPRKTAPWLSGAEYTKLDGLKKIIKTRDWKRLGRAIRLETLTKMRLRFAPHFRYTGSDPHLRYVQHSCLAALYAYRPQEYPGSAILLRGGDMVAPSFKYLVQDWKKYIPDLEVKNFECHHTEFFEKPHVDKLAGFIAGFISQTEFLTPDSMSQLTD